MPLRRLRERTALARLTIGLIKIIHHGKLPSTERGIGGEVEMLLISGVVLIGHADHKHKTNAVISRYLGIPRATVQRKLDALERVGLVVRNPEGRYCMSQEPEADLTYIDEAVRLIQHTARTLDL